MRESVTKLIEEVNNANGPVFATILGVNYMIEHAMMFDEQNGVVELLINPTKYIPKCSMLLSQEDFLTLVHVDPTIW